MSGPAPALAEAPPRASVSYRAERSIGGHPLPVLKSALQKYIRREETVSRQQN